MNLAAHIEETLKIDLDDSLFTTREPVPPNLLRQPHAFLDDIQKKHGPVAVIRGGVLEGADFAKIGHFDPSQDAFLVTGFDAVHDCMSDPTRFRQAHHGEPVFGDVPLFDDPPRQTPYKTLVMRGLGRPATERLRAEVIRPACEMLADRMVAKGRGNLVLDYTGLIPVIVLSCLFDLPPQWSGKLIEQARAVVEMGYDMNAAYLALGEQRFVLTNLLYERRERPGSDFLSWLLDAKLPDGTPLRTSEIVGLCLMLIGAGSETTGRVMGEMMVALLQDESQMAKLRADPGLVPAAVAEGLRWDGPVPVLPRAARVATQLHGVDIPEGALLFCCLVQANRDPGRWDRPDVFDLSRAPQPTMAFGAGAHVCAGHLLARAELETALQVLLERVPNLRLDPDAPAPEILGFASRSVGRIPYLA
jgi:cytochrome P450